MFCTCARGKHFIPAGGDSLYLFFKKRETGGLWKNKATMEKQRVCRFDQSLLSAPQTDKINNMPECTLKIQLLCSRCWFERIRTALCVRPLYFFICPDSWCRFKTRWRDPTSDDSVRHTKPMLVTNAHRRPVEERWQTVGLVHPSPKGPWPYYYYLGVVIIVELVPTEQLCYTHYGPSWGKWPISLW